MMIKNQNTCHSNQPDNRRDWTASVEQRCGEDWCEKNQWNWEIKCNSNWLIDKIDQIKIKIKTDVQEINDNVKLKIDMQELN